MRNFVLNKTNNTDSCQLCCMAKPLWFWPQIASIV